MAITDFRFTSKKNGELPKEHAFCSLILLQVFHLSIADYNSSSNIIFTCKMTLIREHLDEYGKVHVYQKVGRLCRDGTDTPIVRVLANTHILNQWTSQMRIQYWLMWTG